MDRIAIDVVEDRDMSALRESAADVDDIVQEHGDVRIASLRQRFGSAFAPGVDGRKTVKDIANAVPDNGDFQFTAERLESLRKVIREAFKDSRS